MALSREQQADLRLQLQQAVIASTERCLYFAAKWAAELLNSFAPDDDDSIRDDASDTDIDDDNDDVGAHAPQTTNPDRNEARREARELPKYLMAKSFFDCREYERCAAVFLPESAPYTAPVHSSLSPTKLQSTPRSKQRLSSGTPKLNRVSTKPLPKNLSQKALFLALYSRYLSGEKKKSEESETILGPNDGPATPNKEVPGILGTLEEYFKARGALQDTGNSQGWLDYLYGVALVKAKSEALAKQWLLRSVNLNPYNWSAWLELGSLIGSPEELRQISEHLPHNLTAYLFHIHCSQELYQHTPEIFTTLSQMQLIFPSSPFLAQQSALLHYHARDHETATRLFDSLLAVHPHRLDGMDVYSNLLYVLPSRPKLATLAALASTTDKFRPETNCILGNYFSLLSEHEKSVLHFRRALTLDRSFQAAWTLMGHEYIELKNTPAAIESYRRAVDLNRKDYRAWYGLGQGYEMLECHSYSLFYHQRAAALCPQDPKMWAAVASAYAKCGKVGPGIQAYKRALAVGAQMFEGSSFGTTTSSSSLDPLANAVGGALDPQILYEIAVLYERGGQYEEAAAYMELALAQEEGSSEDAGLADAAGSAGADGGGGLGVTQVTSRARLWLAKWSFSCGEWQRTMELANELCQDGVEVEEAKGLIRDVRARMAVQEREGMGAEREDDDGVD